MKSINLPLFLFTLSFASNPGLSDITARKVPSRSIAEYLGANHRILAGANRGMLSKEFTKAADEADPEGVIMMAIRKDISKFDIDIPHDPSKISHGHFCINQIEYEHPISYLLIIYCKYNKIDDIGREYNGCASIKLSQFKAIPNLNLPTLFFQLSLLTGKISGILQAHVLIRQSPIHQECQRLFKELVDQIECNEIYVA